VEASADGVPADEEHPMTNSFVVGSKTARSLNRCTEALQG